MFNGCIRPARPFLFASGVRAARRTACETPVESAIQQIAPPMRHLHACGAPTAHKSVLMKGGRGHGGSPVVTELWFALIRGRGRCLWCISTQARGLHGWRRPGCGWAKQRAPANGESLTRHQAGKGRGRGQRGEEGAGNGGSRGERRGEREPEATGRKRRGRRCR